MEKKIDLLCRRKMLEEGNEDFEFKLRTDRAFRQKHIDDKKKLVQDEMARKAELKRKSRERIAERLHQPQDLDSDEEYLSAEDDGSPLDLNNSDVTNEEMDDGAEEEPGPSKRPRRVPASELAMLNMDDIRKKIHSYEEEGLKVDDSTMPDAGQGVFTTRSFCKGEFVCEYKGKLLTKEQFKEVTKVYDADPDKYGSFVYEFKAGNPLQDWCVDATIGFDGTFGRMINHSRLRQNIRPVVSEFDYKYHVYFLASKEIAAGDEIFFDYKDTTSKADWLKR